VRKTTAMNGGAKAPLRVIHRNDRAGVRAYFAQQGQALLPMLELIEDARSTIDELMSDAARAFVEQLLVISAAELAGPKHPGKNTGALRWHGKQPGGVVLAERKLSIERPRLRTKGPAGEEVAIPVYERLRAEPRLADRIRDILVTGVSTRKYETVLPAMAGTVGISKSSVSRKFVEASERALDELMRKPLEPIDLLVIYIDGIIVDGHHIVAAVGADTRGAKHLLGLVIGASENAEVVKDLLNGFIERGVSTQKNYLFVIDGSKALRSAIEQVFGARGKVQRCRAHKLRNVTERLPTELGAQVRSVMRAAYKLEEKQGIAKLRQQAKWLQADHPDAAGSLLEGLEETFTVNRMQLSPALMRGLATTNIIENPNGRVRTVTHRVARYRDAHMALRWTAAGYLEAQKSFRRLLGCDDLWMLEIALERKTVPIERGKKAA
jgi:putative transposase